MALSSWNIGTGKVANSVSATMTVTLTGNVSVGEHANGWIWSSASGLINSVTDNRGNTWTVRTAYNDGTERWYWVDCAVSTNLIVGDVITVTINTSAGRRLGAFHGIAGLDSSYFDQQGTGTAGISTTPSITTGTLASANSIIFGAAQMTSPLPYVTTEDADYNWLADVDVDGRLLHTAYRVVSSTAADTYSPTFSASQTWHSNYIVYKGADAPPPAVDSALTLMGVG